MKYNLGKTASIGLFALAVIAGSLSTPQQANATHQIGHAIVGGIIGGIIGNAIVNNRRQPAYRQPVYQQPIYQPVRQCFWQNVVEYNRYGQPVSSRIRVCR